METVFNTLAQVIEEQEQIHFKERRSQKENPLGSLSNIDWKKLSEHLNSFGCDKFGFDWITANEAAIYAVDNLGVSCEHPQIKAFIQSIVFEVMDRIWIDKNLIQ